MAGTFSRTASPAFGHQPVVDAVTHDARHDAVIGLGAVILVDDEQRPDQVINRQPRFCKQAYGQNAFIRLRRMRVDGN